MKIIIVSPSLDPNLNVSGISSVSKFIISQNPGHEYIHFEVGKRDNEDRGFRWLLRLFRMYFDWIRLMISTKEGLIHFNLAISFLSILRDTQLILISRVLRKKIVVHIHGGEYLMDSAQPLLIKMGMRIMLGGRLTKIVLSEHERAALEEKFHKGDIYVLPNCVDIKDAKVFQRSPAGDETPVFLFLSRISVDKGLEYIYQALVELKKEGRRFRFLMAGKGPDESHYVLKFSELLRDDFNYLGVVSGEVKTTLLKESQVFLLPSFYEGLPMALLETMSFGLVPVTTDVGSIRDLVTDGLNGIIVARYSSADIVKALKRLMDDNIERDKLSENARATVFTKFDPVQYITRLNGIYNNV
jgi:glycosyltransferase involved in cell wall biosynthesis